MKKNKLVSLLILVYVFLNISKTDAQTWNIGYPDSTKVIATLTDKKLIIKGNGGMKNYPSYGTWKDKAISTIHIAIGITNIDHHCFKDCGELKSVVIPEGLVSIGELAFKNCINLTDINIPNSIIVIQKNAFDA